MRHESGFTLLEVLVAFVLLVVTFAAIDQRLGGAVHAMNDAEAGSLAASEADRILIELGRSRPLSYGLTEGDLPSGVHWELQISPTIPRPAEAILPRVEGHDVVLRLSWTQRGRRRTTHFSTLRLGVEQ